MHNGQLRVMNYSLFIVHYALRTAYCALCIVHCALRMCIDIGIFAALWVK